MRRRGKLAPVVALRRPVVAAAGPHRAELDSLWQVLEVLVRAVADLRERAAIGAGLDPRSPHYSTSRRTLRGAVRYELGLKARRAVTSRSKLARAYYRTGRVRRRYKRNPAAAVAMMVFRYPLTLIRTALVVLLLIALVAALLWAWVPGGVKSGLGRIIPGGFQAASCGPQVVRAGGVRGAAWQVGAAPRKVATWEPDAERIRAGLADAAAGAGQAVGWAKAALDGAEAPTETVEPATWTPAGAACAAVCGTTAAPTVQAGAGIDGVAQAVVAAGATGEHAAIAVAITGPESQFGAQPVNPTSSARGPWQILLSAHPDVTEAQALDVNFAARYALKLEQQSPDSWAGPWAQTFGRGTHEQHLPAARLAVARAAEQSSDAQTAPTVQQVVEHAECAVAVSTGATGGGSFEGRFANGQIPAHELVPLTVGAGQMLRSDAATAAEGMARAYEQRFGRSMCVTDSYRSYAAQVTLFAAKPGLAAAPGTSNHGWGVALDLCDGVESFGTEQHRWVVENGPAFGWVHPTWAKSGGDRPEPWHHEFVGVPGVRQA